MLSKKSFIGRTAERPISYSQLSTFTYDPDEWFTRYILGIKEPPNALMEFGTLVGDSIGTEHSMVPDLVPPGIKEYELRGELKGIHLIGFADHYCPEQLILNENKTSPTKDRWNKKKVDEHQQLTMYCLLDYIDRKTKPEDVEIWLNFMLTKLSGVGYKLADVPVRRFQTKRTMLDIVQYSNHIVETVDKMYDVYVHKSKAMLK